MVDVANKIIIERPLPTLNEYINDNRTHYHKGAKVKKNATRICQAYIQQAINKGLELPKLPMDLKFTWYVKNRRKDKDNIAFAKKFILDGMTSSGLIKNDGWAQIEGFTDTFIVDKNERVEIELIGANEHG